VWVYQTRTLTIPIPYTPLPDTYTPTTYAATHTDGGDDNYLRDF
jgi:hypothetical protein